MEKTLVLIKPDGVCRKMTGQIVATIENLGFNIAFLKQKTLTEKEATELYKEHEGKWHFSRNIRHIVSGPSVVIQVQGENSVENCRQMVDRIRKINSDIISLPRNLVHATDKIEKVPKELSAVGCNK